MNTKKQRTDLKKICDNITEDVKVCNKYSWYQYSEKSTTFFYGSEKKNPLRGTIKTSLEYGKEITTPSEVSLTLKKFYENLFQKLSQNLS